MPSPRPDIPAESIYTDKLTGATADQPGLIELIIYARPGDTIMMRSTGSAASATSSTSSMTRTRNLRALTGRPTDDRHC